jgi:mannosyltransferase
VRPRADQIQVLTPNLKRRLSGVTATVVRLVPIQHRELGVWATGPGLPREVPHIPLRRAVTLPGGPRVWHARRNTEMLLGLALKSVFRRDLRLLFTSAAQRRHTRFTRWLISRMDAVIATSRQAASYLEVASEVVTHGVDTTVFRPADNRANLRDSVGLPDGVWVGSFGRLRPQKGTDLLVRAMLRLMPGHPDLRCLLVGRADDSRFLSEMRRLVEGANLSSRFRFIEELNWTDLARHHAAMDVYVAPARWEGFGLTPLEAMASGVPVVAASVGAFPEVITASTGSIVPPDDLDALVDKISTLLNNSALRVRMGKAARGHVLENHAIEAEAKAINDVYRRLLNTGC